jgi:DNA-binding FrmR family transcriptional regulator
MGIVNPEISAMSHHEREKVKLLQRLRKLRGQLDAVERSLTADEDCGGQLMLLAAVRGGVNSLMGEVLETHIRFHLTDGAQEQIAPELAEDLIDLVRAYLKSAHSSPPRCAGSECSCLPFHRAIVAAPSPGDC